MGMYFPEQSRNIELQILNSLQQDLTIVITNNFDPKILTDLALLYEELKSMKRVINNYPEEQTNTSKKRMTQLRHFKTNCQSYLNSLNRQ